jgi:AraC-like DNA-binding protein
MSYTPLQSNPARFGPDEIANAFATQPRWRIRRVLAFMEANLATAIRADDLAAEACLSSTYFSRLFQRMVGETPFGYLRRLRIERAQQLMLSTEKSLGEIARECGLANKSYLTTRFRQVVGITPAVWRRLQRAQPSPVAAGSQQGAPADRL